MANFFVIAFLTLFGLGINNAYAAPTVNITSPTNNSTFAANSNITITATASEVGGTISKVTFYEGSVLLGTSTASPYSYLWKNVAIGKYSLTAKATDTKGVSTTSAAIAITVHGPPVVTITSPINNAIFSAGSNITIKATATETDGTISSVAFYQGTTLLGTSTTAPYSYTWNNVAANNYSLTAVATDASGGSTTSTAVSIKVHGLPVVSITSPANNAIFTAESNITITATASEDNGTITSVSFYSGTTLLGTSTTAPYSYTWKNVPAGAYSLTAVATDSYNDSVTSTVVTIKVHDLPVVTIPRKDSYAS